MDLSIETADGKQPAWCEHHEYRRQVFGPVNVNVNVKGQDPVVQSIVSLTISLRHKFVKQISSKVTITILTFFQQKITVYL